MMIHIMLMFNLRKLMVGKKMNKLKQLIVVGNGFDIECGLKTTYRDFFFDRYKALCESGAEFKSIATPDAKIIIDLGRMVSEATASYQTDVTDREYRIDDIWDVSSVICMCIRRRLRRGRMWSPPYTISFKGIAKHCIRWMS